MSEKINETEIINISMSIILLAGDARVMINEALSSVESGDFAAAEAKLKDAKKEIAKAHGKQTKMIQGEASGEKVPFSVLFAHAQDTLMVVMSEHNTAIRMVSVFKSFDERLRKLEA